MRRAVVLAGALVAASALVPAVHAAAKADPVGDVSAVFTGPTAVKPGERVTYTLTLRNAGPDAVSPLMTSNWSRSLVVRNDGITGVGGNGQSCYWESDPAKGGFGCGVGSIEPGATKTVTITGTLKSNATGPFWIEAGGRLGTDPNQADNKVKVTAEVAPAADLATSLTGAATARRGDLVAYTATVVNKGPRTATAARATFTLSGGVAYDSAPDGCRWTGSEVTCPLGDLPVNGTKSVTVRAKVGAGVPVGSTLNTKVAATAGLHDGDPANNAATTATKVVAPPPVAKANVAITGKVGALRKGKTGTYVLTVTNHGPSDARNVVVAGSLPKGLTFAKVKGCKQAKNGVKCTLPTLKKGAKVTITLTVKTAKTAKGTLTFTVTAKAATADPSTANNTVRVRRTVTK